MTALISFSIFQDEYVLWLMTVDYGRNLYLARKSSLLDGDAPRANRSCPRIAKG